MTNNDGNEDCEGTPYTYTVTVNPLTGVSFIDDIVVCNGDFINNIEFTSTTQGGETTYEWVATGDDIGLDQTDDGSGLIDKEPIATPNHKGWALKKRALLVVL